MPGTRDGTSTTGAVAEQYARAAVVPVDDPRVDFGADHERVARHAGRDHAIRDSQRVDEAAADGLHVERGAAGRAELRLQEARRRRKDPVRRRRGDHDEVDVRVRDAGGIQRGARGVQREIAGLLRGCGDAPLADSGARANPVVAGVDALGKVLVREDVRRQVAAGSDDAAMHRA